MLGLGIFRTFFGWGLSEYAPYGIYGLAFVITFLALFYRSEIGILFIAFFLPIYTVLDKTIKLDLPFAKDILDILIVAMLAGWLVRIAKNRESAVGPSPLLIPIFLFMSYSLFSFFVGSSYLGEGNIFNLENERLAGWKNYMIMPVLYLISYYNLKDRKWKYALFILLFFTFIAMDFKFHQSFRWVKHNHYFEQSRTTGTLGFLGPNEWGSFHTIYTLFIIGLFLVDKNLWRRAAYLLLIFANSYSLLYSFSRGSYFGFMAGLIFIGLVRKRILLIPVIIFLPFWKSIVPLSVVERVTGTFVEQGERADTVSVGGAELETAGRTELWEKALKYFFDNPVTGTGYNTYWRLTGRDTHNVYLKTMAEQGLLGLFIYLGLYGFALRSGWRLYNQGHEDLVRALGFGFLCAVVGSMVVNFFGDRWTYLQLGGLYWIFWALVDQENCRLRRKKEAELGVEYCKMGQGKNISVKKTMRTKKKVLFVTVIFLSLVFSVDSRGEDSQGKIKWAEKTAREAISKIRKDHPRVFLTKERIVGLIPEAQTSKKHIFDLMKKRMGGMQAALFYALGEPKSLGLSKSRQEYSRIAAEAMMQAIRENKPRISPDDLAVLYDWAFGALTKDEKGAFVNFCKSRIGNEVKIHNDRSHGYRCPPHPQGLIALLSFYGDGIDDSYAERLLIQGIRDTLLDNLAMEQVAGSKGGFADGAFYIFQMGGTFSAFLALGVATNTDFFFKHEVASKLPNHLMNAMLPFAIKRGGSKEGQRYFATFHDNWTLTAREYGSAGQGLAKMFAIAAAEYRRHGNEKVARLYSWFLKEAFGGIPYQGADPISFVLMDWSIPPANPKELGLPLAEALGWDEEKGQIDRDRFGKKAGIGWVCMRSSWDDPDATFAIFKAEPFYYHGHMHHDTLAFMIAKGEELALARAGNYMCWFEGGPLRSKGPGWPQMENFFSRTISTNNLLIYDPEEKFDGWTNDGGQRLTPYWDKEWGRRYPGTQNGNYRDIGGLVRFERTKDYVYAAADATRAYNSTLVTSGGNPPKVNLVQREFVYLSSPQGDQDYFVIFDRVESVKPEFKKIWLLQLRAKPEFDGKYRVTIGDNAGGIHLSEDTSSMHVNQERAELFCKSLLPKDGNRLVRRLGGWVTTQLKQPLKASDNGPMDIVVESTEGLPDHPTVIITAQAPDPNREVFDRFSVWPQANHATTRPFGERVCYFCEGKTPPGKKPAKLLNCVRATKSAPGFNIPAGARVIQEFRHMGIEGIDRDRDSERIDYPWGYGLGYNYGDGNQYGLWRIEVSPKKPSKWDNFLHVLHPSLKGGRMAKTELIESESGNLYGAFVGNRAVIFSRNAEHQGRGSYTLRGNGTVGQLLCNLKPNGNYRITQDGKSILSSAASKQGTLHFESALAGKPARFEFQLSN